MHLSRIHENSKNNKNTNNLQCNSRITEPPKYEIINFLICCLRILLECLNLSLDLSASFWKLQGRKVYIFLRY